MPILFFLNMILFYVYGNGLGHLNRILSYIKHNNIPFQECIIVTNSNYIDYLPKAIEVIQKAITFFKNKEDALPWLKKQIIERKIITELIVDVYPCGFYGELTLLNTLNIKKTLLARLLKPHYFKKIQLSQYMINLLLLRKA